MATKETPVETTAAATLYVVVDSFIADESGAPVLYGKGEVVEAGHPQVKLMPERFRPFEFPHPIKRRGLTLGAPEVRS